MKNDVILPKPRYGQIEKAPLLPESDDLGDYSHQLNYLLTINGVRIEQVVFPIKKNIGTRRLNRYIIYLCS